MRKLLRLLLYRPVLWIVDHLTSAPNQSEIFEALTLLRKNIEKESIKKGETIPFDLANGKFIIFSDQHKGVRDGADDFADSETNYLAALGFYYTQNFHFISLGDAEELWENTLLQVKKSNDLSFAAEAKFTKRNAFTKIFGNHDLDWNIDPLAPVHLKEIYGTSVAVKEGVILQTTTGNNTLKIFCTHGHQGDRQSDGNWFSKFFVAKIWAPLQAYLRINPNTPSNDQLLKTRHNRIMYEWSAAQKNLVLITGHTHQPVFESLTHVERLSREQMKAMKKHNKEWADSLQAEIDWKRHSENEAREDYLKMKPSYFNSGCCCFADGDITGIEISEGCIRLVKWKRENSVSKRTLLEEKSLALLADEMIVFENSVGT
jgi:predicted phosphodiesterase